MNLLTQLASMRPAGGFELIMADPPWRFDLRDDVTGKAKSPQAQYECMPLDEIAAMPVSAMAAKDCLLILWATHPMLPQALSVMAAWGFKFKTSGVWVKRTKHGNVNFGTGYVLRSASEPFLIGTRGSPSTSRSVRSVWIEHGDELAEDERDAAWPLESFSITIEAAVREHSRKPDIAFSMAEQLMPEARRLELFSRQQRPKWTVWGNETEKFPEIDQEPSA